MDKYSNITVETFDIFEVFPHIQQQNIILKHVKKLIDASEEYRKYLHECYRKYTTETLTKKYRIPLDDEFELFDNNSTTKLIYFGIKDIDQFYYHLTHDPLKCLFDICYGEFIRPLKKFNRMDYLCTLLTCIHDWQNHQAGGRTLYFLKSVGVTCSEDSYKWICQEINYTFSGIQIKRDKVPDIIQESLFILSMESGGSSSTELGFEICKKIMELIDADADEENRDKINLLVDGLTTLLELYRKLKQFHCELHTKTIYPLLIEYKDEESAYAFLKDSLINIQNLSNRIYNEARRDMYIRSKEGVGYNIELLTFFKVVLDRSSLYFIKKYKLFLNYDRHNHLLGRRDLGELKIYFKKLFNTNQKYINKKYHNWIWHKLTCTLTEMEFRNKIIEQFTKEIILLLPLSVSSEDFAQRVKRLIEEYFHDQGENDVNTFIGKVTSRFENFYLSLFRNNICCQVHTVYDEHRTDKNNLLVKITREVGDYLDRELREEPFSSETNTCDLTHDVEKIINPKENVQDQIATTSKQNVDNYFDLNSSKADSKKKLKTAHKSLIRALMEMLDEIKKTGDDREITRDAIIRKTNYTLGSGYINERFIELKEWGIITKDGQNFTPQYIQFIEKQKK